MSDRDLARTRVAGGEQEELDTDPASRGVQESRLAIHETRAIVLAIHACVQEMKNLIEVALAPSSAKMRALEMLQEYHPDYTPAGGVKITREDWEALQRRLADQERDRAMERERARGASEAMAALEAKGERFRKQGTFLLAVMAPVFALLGYLATHLLHW